MHGVGKGEMVDVICAVSANPRGVKFDWTFNNSAEFIRVPGGRALTAKNGTTSKLTYTPKTDKDYGTLMCSASNEVGRQRKPCIFHIILAGKINSNSLDTKDPDFLYMISNRIKFFRKYVQT